MQRISTPYSFSLRAFPFLFFGFLGFIFFLLVSNGALQKAPFFLLVAGVLAVGGYYFTRQSQQNLVDGVDDCGDYLVVRKRGEEDTVLLSNITGVNFSTDRRGASARITLTLASPGKFGSILSFAPPPEFHFSAPRQNRIADDLRARVEKARGR